MTDFKAKCTEFDDSPPRLGSLLRSPDPAGFDGGLLPRERGNGVGVERTGGDERGLERSVKSFLLSEVINTPLR